MTVRYIDSSLLSSSLSGSRSIVSRGNSLDRKVGRFVTLEGSLTVGSFNGRYVIYGKIYFKGGSI